MTQILMDDQIVINRITAADLRQRLSMYEHAYQVSTDDFLLRFANSTDDLRDIEDADFWHETHLLLQRLLSEGEEPDWARLQDPEIINEGSKEPSSILYGPGMVLQQGFSHDRLNT